MQQKDLRFVQREIGDVQGLRKYQWHDFHAHLQGFGANEWIFAEGRIVSDRKILRRYASRQDGKTEIAYLDLAAEGCGKLRFQLGAEAVHVDQEGQRNDHQQNDGYNDADNFQRAFRRTPSG